MYAFGQSQGSQHFSIRGWAAWSDLSFRSVWLETLRRMDLSVRRAEVWVPVRWLVLRPCEMEQKRWIG